MFMDCVTLHAISNYWDELLRNVCGAIDCVVISKPCCLSDS